MEEEKKGTPDPEKNIIAKALTAGLRPILRLTVSQWSNENRILTSVSSSEPGPYRYERTPYLREIMDCLGKTSDMQEIDFMKGAQIGATDAGNNWIGYTIDIDPGPMLLVMPTDEAIKKNSRTRITPMINSTPVLKNKIKAVGLKDAENTINSKSFPGGVLMMVGANSPVGLSSTPVKKLFLDEVDRFPHSAGDEGSPVDLAKARTRTFSDKKIFKASTPTNEGESIIAAEFEKGDCRYYNVPCLTCGELFVMTFDCLTWAEGKPETARMACPNCGGLHEERHKTLMLPEEGYSEAGRAKWIPTKTSSNPRRASFHLSSLYSPAGFYSWEEAVRDFLDTENDVNKERTFINTVLGETYKVKGEVPDYENLYNRREEYPIGIAPEGTYFLTMGVDVQPDRLECEVVGWGIGRVSYSVQYTVIVGDTSKEDTWEQLRELINKQFTHADGSAMPIKLTCVDSGYNTKTVYDFCASMGYDRVIPIKGMDGLDVMVSAPKVLNVAKSGKKIGSAKVWGLGVSLLKSELYGFLKLKAIAVEGGPDIYPSGYCHFPEYDRSYFKMLTAEQLQLLKNKKTGKISYQWVKRYERNEALDVRCYARAAAFIMGIDRFTPDRWEKIKIAWRVPAVAVPQSASVKKQPPRRQGGFWKK